VLYWDNILTNSQIVIDKINGITNDINIIDINNKIVDFDLLIEESSELPLNKEIIMIFPHWEKENLIVVTNKTKVSKIINVNPNLPGVAEYIQIAKNAIGENIPNEVEPIVEIYGEWIVITFPCQPILDPNGFIEDGSDFYSKVYIDIKTKIIIGIEVG